MDIIKLEKMDLNVYKETLNNGLNVYLIPYQYKNNYFVNYFTKYGSINLEYNFNGENFTSPKGIAHFLEHKMFEQENGENPFEYYSKRGAGCNAYTSYKSTKYILYGSKNINENLDYLINYINSPYFTDENVEKEKGIIKEEIKMYQDDPEWILNETLQNCLFKNHPFKYDIAGRKEDVESITTNDIKTCYDAFYNPSNMGIVVSGSFNKDEVLNVIKNNKILQSRKDKNTVILKKYNEPYEVCTKEKIIETPLTTNCKIGIGFKLKNQGNNFLYDLYIGMITSILFGSSSSFKEEAIKNKEMHLLAFERIMVDEFLLLEFWINCQDEKAILERFFKYFKEKEITEEEFNRYKKVWISSEVMMSDNIEITVNNIIDDIIDYGQIINDKIDKIKNMDYQTLCQIKKEIDIDNHSIVILKPLNK